MLRIPNSINSKNDMKVKIVQSWDGQRPDIRLLLGTFYAWLLTEDKKHDALIQTASLKSNGLKTTF
jgi:hypothetical protein